MGVFSTRATCTSTSFSLTPTPTIDEDCDASWDNSDWDNTYVALANKNYGAAYSCAATYSGVAFYKVQLNIYVPEYFSSTNGSCVGSQGSLNMGKTLSPMSGSLPTATTYQSGLNFASTACQAATVFDVRPGAGTTSAMTDADCHYRQLVYR
jgi:hypothetical protein